MRKYAFAATVALIAAIPCAFAEKVLVVTEEYPPYNFTDKTLGQMSGQATEVVQAVLKRAQIDYSIESYPWARSYRLAQQKDNVAIYSIGRNEERERLFKWVGIIVNIDVFMYKLKSRTDMKVKQIADLKSLKLGGVRDDDRAMYLGKEGLDVNLVSGDEINVKLLQKGAIDAFPTDEPNLRMLAKVGGYDPDSMDKLLKLPEVSGGLYMAFSLKTPDATVAKCKMALESMMKDGTFSKITKKWSRM